jgi:hypothetical protein
MIDAGEIGADVGMFDAVRYLLEANARQGEQIIMLTFLVKNLVRGADNRSGDVQWADTLATLNRLQEHVREYNNWMVAEIEKVKGNG